MPRHADRQRLGPAQHEPRVERAQNRPFRVLDESQPLDVVVADGDDDAADAVTVAVEVLRRAVDDQIRAELDRALEAGAREGVVDDQAGTALVRQFGHGREIGELHDRVGGRLDKQHARRRSECALDVIEVARYPRRKTPARTVRAPCRTAGTCRRTCCRRR